MSSTKTNKGELIESYNSLPQDLTDITKDEYNFTYISSDEICYAVRLPFKVIDYDDIKCNQVIEKKYEGLFKKLKYFGTILEQKYIFKPYGFRTHSLPHFLNLSYIKGENPNNPPIGSEIVLDFKLYENIHNQAS